VLEPAGALAVAGAKEYARLHRLKDKTLVATASGANMNFDRLRFVAERAEIGERARPCSPSPCPRCPAPTRRFVSLIGARNITEFNYRYNDQRDAHVFVGVQVGVARRVAAAARTACASTATDARPDRRRNGQGHVRHMVGGHAPRVDNEILYRFEFPERPGALMNFLNRMSAGWNISLFHYRNHGADYGRVLVGMQVPPGEMGAVPRIS
jgi:threonine dehydratase